MKEHRRIFGDEVEGLLRELAADPRSTLLRVPRPRTVQGLLERQIPIPSSATGLTVLERNLLAVHREELAFLLRQACVLRFFAEKRAGVYLSRALTTKLELRVPSVEDLRDASRPAFAASESDLGRREDLELLEACLQDNPVQPPAITQLARASQRLHPSDSAECCIGLDQVLAERFTAGRRVLEQLVARNPAPLVTSLAWANMGLSQGLQGLDHAALECYRRASQAIDDAPHAIMAWLFFAVKSCNESETLRAARRLDEAVSKDHPSLDTFVVGYSAQFRPGGFASTPACREFVIRIEDRIGPASRRIAHVLA